MKLREKFTKWYCQKGYRMEWQGYDYGDPMGNLVFICPVWVLPLAYLLFSPSIYYMVVGYDAMNEEENDNG